MSKTKNQENLDKVNTDIVSQLVQNNYLFRGMDAVVLRQYLPAKSLKVEKLFSNRPIYTAFLPEQFSDVLYVLLDEGIVIARSTPLDRIVSITYPGTCFGMRNLPFSHGMATRGFPTLIEAYKTSHIIKIPLESIINLHQDHQEFGDRYQVLFQLREKFQYHLLNCSAYPPQAVATLLRGLIYQEKELGNQPMKDGKYIFDIPIDLIAHACQLNQRTVEQVLKGMQQVGLIDTNLGDDLISVIDPEGLKEVYSATRSKVSWWPLK